MPTISHTVTVGAAPTQYFFEHATLNVPKFDTALGSLVSIDVSGNVLDRTVYGWELLCEADSGRNSTTFTNHSYTDLIIAGTTYGAGSGGEAVKLTARTPYDGITDLAGTSGQRVLSSYTYDLVVPTPITDAAALRLFSGGGTAPIGLVLHKSASYGQNVGACAEALTFTIQQSNQYTYTVTVTYTYQ